MWAVGWNLAGYLPECDVTVTEDWGMARDILVYEISRSWDHDYEMLDDDDEDGRLAVDARYLDAHTEIHNATYGEPLTVAIEGESLHSFPMMFWIDQTDAEPDGNL